MWFKTSPPFSNSNPMLNLGIPTLGANTEDMRITCVPGLKSTPRVQFLAATAIVSWMESQNSLDLVCVPWSPHKIRVALS